VLVESGGRRGFPIEDAGPVQADLIDSYSNHRLHVFCQVYGKAGDESWCRPARFGQENPMIRARHGLWDKWTGFAASIPTSLGTACSPGRPGEAQESHTRCSGCWIVSPGEHSCLLIELTVNSFIRERQCSIHGGRSTRLCQALGLGTSDPSGRSRLVRLSSQGLLKLSPVSRQWLIRLKMS
jgi:hypothetical protein